MEFRMEGLVSRPGTALIMLVALVLLVGGRPTAGEFDPGRASFSVEFRDEVTSYRVTGVFVLPGESLAIGIPTPQTLSPCRLDSPAGRIVERGRNRWTWEAPPEPGDVSLVIRCPEPRDSVVLNAFVMVPFDEIEGGVLNGYCIGEYPDVPLDQISIYEVPEGFVEVTEHNLCTSVSPHFQLGQFLCKQSGDYPKYMVLRERLVLKLELILEKMNEAGYAYETLQVMSGYRTPHYNSAIGNVKYSRHLWGGAADIFADGNPVDGMMDDLNRDGEIDRRDAGVIYDIIEGMSGEPWYAPFRGGLARYNKTSSHGPFVHVDVRGRRARWRN